jgi:hypothetical protein
MIIYEINGVKAQVIDGEIWVRAEIVQATITLERTEGAPLPAPAHRHYKKRKVSTDEPEAPTKKRRQCSLCHKPGHKAPACPMKGSTKVAKVRESFDGDDDE